ncbi:unnamed protein product [Trichogramma brassicae]|uniref:Uncharacterized protein n=1 Tax=Trichogramma brassicae TaxID=86971 RepID=A0A6H5IM78_9HYME|nr:unnamed protein product [Trichogramma brassicae]
MFSSVFQMLMKPTRIAVRKQVTGITVTEKRKLCRRLGVVDAKLPCTSLCNAGTGIICWAALTNHRRLAECIIRERTYEQRREWKICLESERSSSVRAERDILGDVYVGLTSTARVVRSYVAPVKSASAGTSRPECARENQWIQRPSRPQGQPRVDLDQEKIPTSCGESGGPAFGHCVCESYAPTRPPGLRSSRLPSTGYSGTLGGRTIQSSYVSTKRSSSMSLSRRRWKSRILGSWVDWTGRNAGCPDHCDSRRNCKNSGEHIEAPFEMQDEEARSVFLTAAESERRAWIEEKYPGFMSFMNRQHSNRGGNNDDYPSDELNDAQSDAGLPETYNDEEPRVTVDELAKLLRDAELTTQRPTSAMSNTYVNSVPRRSNNVRFQSPPLDNAQRSCSLNEIYDRPQNDLVTSSHGALNRVASLSPRVLPRHATNPFIADCQSPATLQSSRPTATITEIVPSRSNSRMSCGDNTQSDRVDAMSRTSTNAFRARDLESRRSITSRRNDSRDPESNHLRDSYPPVQRNVSMNNPLAYTHYMPNSISLFNDIVKQIPKFDGTPYKLDLFSIAVEEKRLSNYPYTNEGYCEHWSLSW